MKEDVDALLKDAPPADQRRARGRARTAGRVKPGDIIIPPGALPGGYVNPLLKNAPMTVK